MKRRNKPSDLFVRHSAALLLITTLAACGRGDEGPGGVTRSEQKALDDAAEMVEQRQLNPSAIPPAPAISATPAPAQSN